MIATHTHPSEVAAPCVFAAPDARAAAETRNATAPICAPTNKQDTADPGAASPAAHDVATTHDAQRQHGSVQKVTTATTSISAGIIATGAGAGVGGAGVVSIVGTHRAHFFSLGLLHKHGLDVRRRPG